MQGCRADSRPRRGDNVDWIINELRHIDLGDERLFERLLVTARAFASRPMDSINEACGSWAAAKAAYRLFDNEKFDERDLFVSHQLETRRRLSKHALVFALQDTTFLDFDSHHAAKGLGSISKGYGKKDKLGLIMHPALAVAETGFPLGLLALECWSRPIRERTTRSQRSAKHYRQPIEEKESRKWLSALHDTIDTKPPKCRVITVADREADIYELMVQAMESGSGFVIRSRVNRRIDRKSSTWKRTKQTTPPEKMWELLAYQPAQGKATIELPSGGRNKRRTAEIEIRYMNVVTPIRENLRYGAAKLRDTKLPSEIEFYAINAKELNAPNAEDAIDWTLITSEPVTCLAEALQRIHWYKLRWSIEVYFRILKSGCRVESCRLGEAKRLQKYITLMAIIAYRLMVLDRTAREVPDKSCETVLSKVEWQALYCRVNRTNKLPTQSPSSKEVLIWIAKLGGFLGRKGDGYPGPMVLWRGWQRLQDTVDTWLAIRATSPP